MNRRKDLKYVHALRAQHNIIYMYSTTLSDPLESVVVIIKSGI